MQEYNNKQKKDFWGYPPFNEWIWKSYDNTTEVNVDEFLKKHSEAEFFIGTDSQTTKDKCTLTTAIIAYNWGKGGSIIIHTQKVKAFNSLRQKLIAEAMRSLETAWYVDPKIPEDSHIVIHLDVNSNVDWESGKYKDELVGMIVGNGFRPAIKPDSWGSSKVADKRCRNATK